jgi:hypothetical protein
MPVGLIALRGPPTTCHSRSPSCHLQKAFPQPPIKLFPLYSHRLLTSFTAYFEVLTIVLVIMTEIMIYDDDDDKDDNNTNTIYVACTI